MDITVHCEIVGGGGGGACPLLKKWGGGQTEKLAWVLV